MNQRYQMQDTIGTGGMGTVYRAIDTQTGATVAIKTLKADMLTPAMIERFQREGHLLRELNHPNIVQRLDAFEHDGQYYLVMEYVAGYDLQTLINSGTLDSTRALEIGLDMADALTRTHRLGIIHRDIKPANVLVGHDRSVKLTDFGIALQRETTRMTAEQGLIGTLAYLSPELINHQPATPAADIWAFGVLLYEMLTGRLPFDGENTGALINAILFSPIPQLEAILPNIPISLVDLIEQMLAKDPASRLPSVRLVGAELERLLQGGTGTGWVTPALGSTAALSVTRFETVMAPIRHNLPSDPTPFVGRSAELQDLTALLHTPAVRLITIVATGGMGKSRLALQLAHQQVEQWADGVYWVDLVGVGAVSDIIPKVAQAVGLAMEAARDPQRQLLDFCRDKRLLLVVDNYEHLLEGAQVVADILSHAPQVKVIATSRERLRLTAESVFTLGGIDQPTDPTTATQNAAVQLFVNSARRALATFALDEANTPAVVEICQRVGGMPLAIVLAAGWVNLLSPSEIAEALRQNLDLLESEDAPERHRSIRAVFDYTLSLLDDTARTTLHALTVFRGGFTLEAAQAVTGANLRTLQALVNYALVQRSPDRRFSLHELLRQYAESTLHADSAHRQAIDQRHSDYYLTYLVRQPILGVPLATQPAPPQAPFPVSEQYIAAFGAVAVELENIITAWRWGVAGQRWEPLTAAAAHLRTHFTARGPVSQARDLFTYAIETLAPMSHTEASAACYVACFCEAVWMSALDDTAFRAHIDRVVQLNATLTLPDVLRVYVLVVQTKRDNNVALLEQAYALARQQPNAHVTRVVVASWAMSAMFGLHDYAKSKALLLQALALGQQLGDGYTMALDCLDIGRVYAIEEEWETARYWTEEALRLARLIHAENIIPLALNNLTEILSHQGRMAESLAYGREALQLYFHNGNHYGLCLISDSLGNIAYKQGDYAAARTEYERCFTYGTGWLQSYAHKQIGFTELKLGNTAAAASRFTLCLQSLVDAGGVWQDWIFWDTVLGLAHVLTAQGDLSRALSIAYACRANPAHERHLAEQAALIERLEGELDAATIAEAQAAAERIELEALVKHLLAEFGS